MQRHEGTPRGKAKGEISDETFDARSPFARNHLRDIGGHHDHAPCRRHRPGTGGAASRRCHAPSVPTRHARGPRARRSRIGRQPWRPGKPRPCRERTREQHCASCAWSFHLLPGVQRLCSDEAASPRPWKIMRKFDEKRARIAAPCQIRSANGNCHNIVSVCQRTPPARLRRFSNRTRNRRR